MRDVYNLSADNALKFQASIINAKQDGRKIQIKQMFEEEWQDLADSVVVFNFSNYDYRIKPKPRQRPYKSFTEFKDDLVRVFSKLLANWREINRHPLRDLLDL